MSNYKLVYFNIRGRAEKSRYIFAQAGVKYEDKRIEKEDWLQLKPSTPTGMLPMLEVDGKQLVGGGVIAQFLAERFGLAGSNDVENAELAGITDVMHDFMTRFMTLRYEQDEDKKAQLKKKLDEEDIPKYWGIIEGMCKKNDSTEGWIYGNKTTYVDIGIFNMLEYVIPAFPTFTENFPRVAKLNAAVEALPNIAEWLKKRPVTEN